MTQELNATANPTESPGSEQAVGAGLAATVGDTLRGLRIARGLSLEEVSSRIKFAPRQIDALENEQWEKLPTGASLRGLIRSYARLLETDPAAIVSLVESQVGGLSSPGSVHRVSRTIPVAVGGPGEDRSGTPWGWLLVIVALVVVLAGYAFWQQWFSASWLPSWLSGGNS